MQGSLSGGVTSRLSCEICKRGVSIAKELMPHFHIHNRALLCGHCTQQN